MHKLIEKRLSRRQKRTGTYFTKARDILAKEYSSRVMKGDIEASILYMRLSSEQFKEDHEAIWKRMSPEAQAEYLAEQEKKPDIEDLARRALAGDMDAAFLYLKEIQNRD